MSMLLEITQNQMSLYTALIGVAGTLLGTILGYVLSNLNRLGIRKVSLNNLEVKYCFGSNHFGEIVYEDYYDDNGNIANSCYMNADLFITNPSEQPFNVNNLYLIVKCDKEYYKSKIKDKENIKKMGGCYTYEHITSLTIAGKSGEHFKLNASFDKAIPKKNNLKFYLEYLSVKGKVKKKKIKIR